MTTFEAVQAQYEKNKNAASGSRFANSEERMKKYFTTVLPKGKDSEERRIRILPMKDGSSPFVEVYFHEIQVDGKWVKLYDPKQEGKRSPLNEVYAGLMETKIESDKELAKNYRARKFYIVKIIDRDHEADGPKFWRFKHNSKQEGILDKIFPIFRNKGDITDPKTGRDLVLTLTLTRSNAGKEYTAISSIIQDDAAPLHTDEATATAWLADTLTWSDVYSKKPEEYLEMVANGETPKWDIDGKKWISASTAEETIGGSQTPTNTPVDPQADVEPDSEDELPF